MQDLNYHETSALPLSHPVSIDDGIDTFIWLCKDMCNDLYLRHM